MTTEVAADLCFRLESPEGERIEGHLTGSGHVLDLEVDDPGAFAGAGDAEAVRWVAEELAVRGLVVRVRQGRRVLVCLGAVRSPWWQRRVTRSRHVRVGSLRGVWTAAQARAAGRSAVLPSLLSAPPPTLSPLLPTLGQRPRRVTSTHDRSRAGSPRLVLAPGEAWAGGERTVYWLGDHVVVGSDPACDIVLPGLAARHCEVVHDEEDEFVVHALDAPLGQVRIHGRPVGEGLLRTGTRLEVGGETGEHLLVFAREEYADHGRPHGGRIGGELGHQRPQRPRHAS